MAFSARRLAGFAALLLCISAVSAQPAMAPAFVDKMPGTTPPVQGPSTQVAHAVAPVAHAVAPVAHAVSPVAHAEAPVAHVEAPVAQAVAPVAHAVSPIARAEAPATHATAPTPSAEAPLLIAEVPEVHDLALLEVHSKAPAPSMVAASPIALSPNAPSPIAAESTTGIISAQGTKFVDKNCHEYAYTGANVWQIVEAQGGQDGGTPESVQKMFQLAKKTGINVLRFFPFGIFSKFTLQTAPGEYNQKGWDALDEIISQAAQHDIKLVMPFADNWTPNNGKIQYALQWGGKTDPDAFYTDEGIKTMYKNHIEAMANHMNPLTGRKYKDEPAIFAWDLMNEMRSSCDSGAPNASCTATATAYMQAWVEEMAVHTKKVDPNHMVTVGEEGFYPASSPKAKDYNPGLKFAEQSGQDFVNNHKPAEIDYATSHIWIDNWQTNTSFCGKNDNPSCGPEFITRWLTSHIEDANKLNKPFVVEEFGNNAYSGVDPAIRNPIFGAVYDLYTAGLKNDTNLRGAAFWQWEFSAGLDPAWADKGYSVVTEDTTWNNEISPSFKPTQELLAAKNLIRGCTPGSLKALTASTVQPAAGRKLRAMSI